MPFKRTVFLSDLHCGHRVGLTPPKYQSALLGDDFHRIQVELWNYYRTVIQLLKPIDNVVINGDAVDGAGSKSGGTELITTDPNIQIQMAFDSAEITEAKKFLMTYGTPYHVGQTMDHEKILADKLSAEIRSHLWLDINGTVFDVKHKIGNSSVPHGKGTPIAKDWLWNTLWSLHDEQPKADVFIRGHVHNFFFCGGADWIGMTLPALQGQGSKFGARQCSQEVHFGIVWFDCYDNGECKWNRKILRAQSQKQKALIL